MLRTIRHRALALSLGALLSAAATAGDATVPTADEIRADAVARGEALFATTTHEPLGGIDRTGLCYGGSRATELALAPLPPLSPIHADAALVCPDLGTYWIRRTNTAAMGAQRVDAWAGPFGMHGLAGQHGLARRIRIEVEQRASEFLPVGTNAPQPGPNGELPSSLDAGGVVVALAIPPLNSADMFVETALVDPESGLYWAHRSGGFGGVDTWIGPFGAPFALDAAPTAVRPSRLRAQKRARRVAVTIRRELLGDGLVRVRRRDYAPADIHLGSGLEVLRVLRVNRHRIRVRVRIAPHAASGVRDVRVKGEAASGLLTVR